MRAKSFYMRTDHSYKYLLSSVNSYGFAFGIIEAVHRPDIHHHHDAVEGDGEQDEYNKQTGPNRNSKESYTVQRVSEGH